jgi:oxygen-independent coproporphyrinogen-3 oxidase
MRVEAQGHGVIGDELLNSEERADEYLLMGLRLAEGIDPVRYKALSGRALDPRRIEILQDEGAIIVEPDGRARDHAGISGAGCRGRGSGGVIY